MGTAHGRATPSKKTQQVTTVNLVRIANGLNGNADRKSNYRRIQRFFALFDLDYDLLAELVVTLLPHRKDWLITLDRTHWQFGQLQINILLVGIVFQGVAFPLYWTMLPKKGNSNTQERIALMEQVIALLGPQRIRAWCAIGNSSAKLGSSGWINRD